MVLPGFQAQQGADLDAQRGAHWVLVHQIDFHDGLLRSAHASVRVVAQIRDMVAGLAKFYEIGDNSCPQAEHQARDLSPENLHLHRRCFLRQLWHHAYYNKRGQE